MSGQHVEIHGLSGGTLGNKFHVPDGWVVLYAGLDNHVERVSAYGNFSTPCFRKIIKLHGLKGEQTRHTQSRTSDEYLFLCPWRLAS